jgi:hypothetical protein
MAASHLENFLWIDDEHLVNPDHIAYFTVQDGEVRIFIAGVPEEHSVITVVETKQAAAMIEKLKLRSSIMPKNSSPQAPRRILR